EQVGSFFLRGAKREFVVRTVHRVTRLKGDDLRPTALAELFAKLGRRIAERFVVVVHRKLQALDAAADVNRLALVYQVIDGRVRGVLGPEYLLGFLLAIRLPDVFRVNDGEHNAFGIAKGDVRAGLN